MAARHEVHFRTTSPLRAIILVYSSRHGITEVQLQVQVEVVTRTTAVPVACQCGLSLTLKLGLARLAHADCLPVDFSLNAERTIERILRILWPPRERILVQNPRGERILGISAPSSPVPSVKK